jgi:6-phosphogluconolactonase
VTIDNPSRRQFLQRVISASTGVIVGTVLRGRQCFAEHSAPATIYVGTYTTTGKSEGIYGYTMDPDSGALSRFGSFKSVNPSFLAIDNSRRFLYAVNEISDFLGKPSGGVSAYAIDKRGQLRLLNEQATQGADPCYLSIDEKKRTLLVANYTGGNVSVLPLRSDGTLSVVSEVDQHEGSGPKEQQKGPHAHCIIFDRTQRHALAADLGIDKVIIYNFDRVTGKLTPGKQPFAELQPGAGPRHLAFHPSGKYLFVISELDSTMTTFAYNEQDGTLTHVDSVSTLPADFSGVSYCADVHVSQSGKFLYGSNRGHNSIVVFEIDPGTGKLKLVEHVSTEGNWPRNFTLDPSGKFLLVANQRSDNVVVFTIDAQTGRLKSTGHVEEIPSPVCLRFL